MASRPTVPASQRELVKLSLLMRPDNARVGKGHDAKHEPHQDRGWR